MKLDFIGITIIIIFFIQGYRKGMIVAVFSVLSILLGMLCALKLSGLLGTWLLEKGWVTSGWAQVLSYAILFIGVVILVRLLAKAIQSTLNLAMLGWLNGLVGGVLYAFAAAVVWSSLLWIGNQMQMMAPETIAASKTYKYLEPLAPWVYHHIGKLLPFAKDVFSDLHEFFDQVNVVIPKDVDTH